MNHATFQCDKAIISLISLSAGQYPVLRFATIPKRLLITGKPQFGQGKLSIFVPHLGQVIFASSVPGEIESDTITRDSITQPLCFCHPLL